MNLDAIRTNSGDINAGVPVKKYNVCLMHMADPRGLRVGGTETYVRDYITFHPRDMNLLYVGPDEIGDLEVGKVARLTFRGREIDYLPTYKVDNSLNIWADSIAKTDTFVFAKSLVMNWRQLRRLLRGGKYSVELRRVELAPLVASLGVPFVQMLHVMQDKGKTASGVLARHRYLGVIAEFLSAMLCDKFYLVNPNMTSVFKKKYWPFAKKFDTLTTWANTEIYSPAPFCKGPLQLIFAGRADDFKRLDIMLDVVALVNRKLEGDVVFNYVGDGDLTKYPQFAEVKNLTVLHGRIAAGDLAELQKSMHIGLLTSDFEGMPRFVMETLSSGRPVVALHLPQLEEVIKDRTSGFLIRRSENQVTEMADRIVETATMIRGGGMDPTVVSLTVEPFSPRRLLSKIFNDHRRLHELPPHNV